MEIFKINPDGSMEFNEMFINQIPELKNIRRRLVPCKGDADGRKKIRNFQELKYVFFMGDWTDRNMYREITDEEAKHEKARIASRLPGNWKPDKEVKDAIEAYKALVIELDSSVNLLMTLIDANNLNIKLVHGRMEINKKLMRGIDKLSDSITDVTPTNIRTDAPVNPGINPAVTRLIPSSSPVSSSSLETISQTISAITNLRKQISDNIKDDSVLVKILVKDRDTLNELKKKVQSALNKQLKTSDGGYVWNREIPNTVLK